MSGELVRNTLGSELKIIAAKFVAESDPHIVALHRKYSAPEVAEYLLGINEAKRYICNSIIPTMKAAANRGLFTVGIYITLPLSANTRMGRMGFSEYLKGEWARQQDLQIKTDPMSGTGTFTAQITWGKEE